MEPSPSDRFKRFLDAFFGYWGYAEWRSGLDVESLFLLTTEEQRQAEELLLQHLEQGSPDHRIAVGLGYLRSQRAIPTLTKRVQALRGDPRIIEPAIALWRIAHAQEALSALIEALTSLPHWCWRMDAAIALGECRCQQAAQALQQALSDEHDLVRHHATNSLLIIHGLSPKDHPLAFEMMSDDSKKREVAMTRILALIENRSLPDCEGRSERE
jgi:hypothetical protein